MYSICMELGQLRLEQKIIKLLENCHTLQSSVDNKSFKDFSGLPLKFTGLSSHGVNTRARAVL